MNFHQIGARSKSIIADCFYILPQSQLSQSTVLKSIIAYALYPVGYDDRKKPFTVPKSIVTYRCSLLGNLHRFQSVTRLKRIFIDKKQRREIDRLQKITTIERIDTYLLDILEIYRYQRIATLKSSFPSFDKPSTIF